MPNRLLKNSNYKTNKTPQQLYMEFSYDYFVSFKLTSSLSNSLSFGTSRKSPYSSSSPSSSLRCKSINHTQVVESQLYAVSQLRDRKYLIAPRISSKTGNKISCLSKKKFFFQTVIKYIQHKVCYLNHFKCTVH